MSELDYLVEDVKQSEMSIYPFFSREEVEKKKQRIREIERETKT